MSITNLITTTKAMKYDGFKEGNPVLQLLGYGLANMGPQGIRRLKQVSKQKKDRYASEMATMVLNDIIYTEET
ncbi:MAG: hypothetical protein U9O50_01455 [Acidobacteriota bacterium]|nr:hypothetical protein [Acidobacteriota bacterium]